jgi:hypothetical protein
LSLSNGDKTTQDFKRLRFALFLVTVLTLCASTPQANAGVRIAMADDLEKNQNFLVTTDIYYRKLEGHHVKHIDSSFLTAGGTKHITVLAVWPLLYSRTYAYAMHPAFFADSAKSDKAPFALRTVVLPALRPQSWRRLLESGEPPRQLGGGIIPGIVDDHLYGILTHYLPAFDRARIKEDLRQYLPLLRELAAFAHREGVYKKTPVAVKPGQDPISLQEQGEPQAVVLEHYRREMDVRLDEITAWLALEQNKRAAMHDWMERFQKGDYVFREMMSGADRTKLLQWLDRSIEGTAQRTLQWTSQASGLLYTAKYEGMISSDQGVSWGVNLTVDLNPILGLRDNRRYREQSYPRFYRNADGMWNVKQLAGRK